MEALVGSIIFIAIGIQLIVNGIIGLKRGKIKAANIFLKLYFLPMKFAGEILANWLTKGEYEKGKGAKSASIAIMLVGLVIICISAVYFLYENNLIVQEQINWMIPSMLILAIVGCVIGIVVAEKQTIRA